ncbi:hypothetical protein [Alicyclobacillus macrosporangiidus]|uniref:hypothetical protein n=1 Tax=Alicyclobacillus macrosporangiidus TaxID=392015 RepID=UPI0012DE6E9B|nr:hypothetical protein [Alicyclobacillus macrosporangiidus]
MTKDVDAYLGENAEAVREAARRVARREGLDENWLNDGVKGFFYGTPPQTVVAEFPGLRVYSVTPEYMIAMKAVAGRAEDVRDLKHLVKFLRLKNKEQVLEIIEKYVPPRLLTPKIQYIIESLFDHEDEQVRAPFENASSRKIRRRVCSIRCQTSTAPVSTCRCICGGKNHGTKARQRLP